MSPQADRAFRLPDQRRAPRWAWWVAALVHVPLVLFLLRPPPPGIDRADDFRSVSLADSTPVVTMRYYRPRRVAVIPAPRYSTAPEAAPAKPGAPVAAPPPAPAPVIAHATIPAPVDTAALRPGTVLRPRYGDGRLWVEPLAESPRRIASVLTGKSQAELTDSAVTAMVQTYLDEMARERAENPMKPPSWTTRIGGKTVGVDQKWIYLGPLKVPTALLALLPIKLQANPTLAEYNAKLQQMRSDLLEAARRSENYEEFKKAVKDLHDQVERKREFQRNQRTPPDSGRHG